MSGFDHRELAAHLPFLIHVYNFFYKLHVFSISQIAPLTLHTQLDIELSMTM